MKALILNQSSERLSRAWITRWMRGLSRLLARRRHRALSQREIVIVFVTAAEMKRMNKMYRGKDYATDILSFEAADPDTVGELVLCLPTIIAQSKRTGLGANGELGYMLVHGVLHLLGYDHEDAKSQAVMFAMQDDIYSRLESRVGLR